jgi:hypothetical protein
MTQPVAIFTGISGQGRRRKGRLRRIPVMLTMTAPLPRVRLAGRGGLAVLIVFQSLPIAAVSAPDIIPPEAAASAPLSAASSAAASRGPGGVQFKVIEDDNVRIEETRKRGEVQRVSVQGKRIGGEYQILVHPGQAEVGQERAIVGRSAWSLFNF